MIAYFMALYTTKFWFCLRVKVFCFVIGRLHFYILVCLFRAFFVCLFFFGMLLEFLKIHFWRYSLQLMTQKITIMYKVGNLKQTFATVNTKVISNLGRTRLMRVTWSRCNDFHTRACGKPLTMCACHFYFQPSSEILRCPQPFKTPVRGPVGVHWS